MQPVRIAILQLARFGDLIQTSPFIQRLWRAYPNPHITLIVDERVRTVAEMLTAVANVVPVNLASIPWKHDSPLSQRLSKLRNWLPVAARGAAFDHLYILNQDPFSGALAELIPASIVHGPRLRRILPAPHRYLTLALQDRRYNPVHLSEIWASYAPVTDPIPIPEIKKLTLGTGFALLGVDSSVSSMKIKRFAINLGAKAAGRRPPWEKLAELTTGLLTNDWARVVLLGMKDDRTEAVRLIESLPENVREHVLDLTGRTSVNDLAGVLAGCDVLISGDTGSLQLAAATGTKCIGLFMAGANPVETGPYMDGAVAIVRRNTLDFNEQQRDDLHDLPVETVISLAEMLAHSDVPNGRDVNAGNAFAVLMAGFDGVGFSYTPVVEDDGIPLGKARRWLPYLRYLLGQQSGSTESQTTAWQATGLSGDDAETLSRLLIHPESAISGEERWLGNIVQAFQGETVGLLNTIRQEVESRVMMYSHAQSNGE